MAEIKESIESFKNLLSSHSYYTCECVICGGKDFKQICSVDRYGFDYKTGICKFCGNVQQIEYYNADTLSIFYEEYYSSIYRNGITIDATYERQRRKGSEIFNYCKDFLQSKAKILDIGCSSGGVLSIFSEKNFICRGCDYDDTYLSFGRERGLDLTLGGVQQLPPDERYDLIILRHVLEHIPDPVKFLHEVKGILSENGKIYIEVPSMENVLDGGYDFDYSAYFQNAHFIHFTVHSIQDLMQMSGLQIEKSDRYIKLICSKRETAIQNFNFSGSFAYSLNVYRTGRRKRDGYYRKFIIYRRNLKYAVKMILKILHLYKR